MTRTRIPTDAQARLVRLAFAGMALISAIAGLGLYAFSDYLALEETTARLMISVFLLTAVADTLVLYFWDRLFKRKP